MAFSRYERAPILDFGRQYGTNTAHEVIRKAIAEGILPVRTIILHEAERLDHISGRMYGNARYWWVIASASHIGWCLQVPAGTEITIPDLAAVSKLVG